MKMGRLLSLLLIGALLIVPFQSHIALAQALTEEQLGQLSGSEVLISDIKKQGAALNSEAPAYGTVETKVVTGQSFTEALRFATNVEPSGTYLLQYVLPIAARIEKDDVILATFYARTISSTVETAEGKASLVMEKTGTWEKSVNETIAIPSVWKKFFVPIKAALLMEENTPQVTFRLGYKPQVIEIADLKVVNYKKAVTIDNLPSTPVYYAGMEEDAPWRAEANQRIEQIRKGDLKVEVKDADGHPIQDADVHVKMTKHDFKFGTAVNSTMIFGTDQNAATYRTKLKENFNSVVMENEMKWPWWEADKSRTVKLYNWLGENNFDIRGHALLWDGSTRLPADIPDLLSDKTTLEKRIQDHFHELAGFFRGRLYNWDVLNEPVLNSMIRSTYEDQGSVMAKWFKSAKEADPSAKLYVNETQILGVDAPVIQNFSNILQSMKDHGAPINGIGIQAHFGSTPVSPMAFYDQITHFTQYAPEIAITEYDMNTSREDVQGNFTRDMLMATFSHPNVKSFTMWGFWDGAHWQNNAPLFRNDWSLKPSGEQWHKLIYETWWTDVTGKTDASGQYGTRGFYGDYDITVTRNGNSQMVKTSLLQGKDNKVSIVWGEPSQGGGNPSFFPLPIPTQTADITAPVWPYGSTFGVSEASPTSVTLNWPHAQDNQKVDGYLIYKDGDLLTQTTANVTSYDVTGLIPGRSYTLHVEALDQAGNRSLPSSDIQATATSGTDQARPGWTKGSYINVADLGQTGASLSWPSGVDNDGAAGYRIYVNGQIAGDTIIPNFTLTGLIENSQYTVRVEAKDGEGNLSAGGPIVTFRTLGVADTTPPAWASSSLLNETDTTANSVKLDWSAAQDAHGVTAYRVFQGNQELVTLPATTKDFLVNGLSPNTSFTFKVEAGDGSNNWSQSGPTITLKTNIGPDASAPQWPVVRMLTYSALTDHLVTLNWTPAKDNIGVSGYRVYQNNTVIADVYGDVQSYAVTNLAAGQPYTFRVEARDAAGNWTSNGPVVTATTVPGVTRTQQELYPSDDAFIQAPATLGGAGTTNNIAYLRYKNAAGVTPSDTNKNTGNNRRAYLKFPLTTVTGNVYDASLNLYVFAVQTPNKDINMDLYQTGDNWSESGSTSVNWLNKPVDGSKIASTIIRNAGYWKKFTVTDQVSTEVNGDRTISFKLQDDAWLDQNVDIHSKEATGANVIYRPYLSVGTEQLPIDTTPPSWTSSTLNMSHVQPQAVTLTWSSAQDQRGINGYTVYQNGTAIATVGSDVYSYAVTDLMPLTAYTFKVEARDAGLVSSTGPTVSLTTPSADILAPTWSPTASLTAQDLSRFAVTLQWQAATDQYGVAAYDIYNGNTVMASVYGNLLSYHATGLTAGTEYDYHVTARDAAGNLTAGPTLHVKTLAPDSTKPNWSGGSLLTASVVTSTGYELNWPTAADETGIHHYLIKQDDSVVAEVSKDVRSYYVNGMNEDTRYPLQVVAVDDAGNRSQPLELAVRTLKEDTITPQWPTGSRITATPESDREILTWDAAQDNVAIKQYVLYRDGVQAAVVDGSLTSYTILGTPGATGIYKVEAQDLVGNATVFGPSTNDPIIPVPSDTTPPGWPSGSKLNQGAVSTTSIQLSWSEAIDRMGVTQYKLLKSGIVVATTSRTSWLVNGLTPDTAYDFKVEAADEANNWSNTGPSIMVRTLTAPSPVVDPPVTTLPDPKQPIIDVNNGEARITIPSQGLTAQAGKVSAVLDKATLDAAFKKVEGQATGTQNVSIQLSPVAGTQSYTLQIPTDYLTKQDGLHGLEVSTELGALFLPSNLFANNAEATGHANIRVNISLTELPKQTNVGGKTKSVVDIHFEVAGQPLKFESKDIHVQVRLPNVLTTEERNHMEFLNVWYVNAQGEAKLVPTGHYDPSSGDMQFRTNHFSTYAVSYGKPTFEDLTSTPWAQKSIEALASKGIIQGVSDRAFNPTATITRADFTKLLVETFGLQATAETHFEDVQKGAYYERAVGIANKLGIINGLDDHNFNPQDAITRQDMFVMIARTLAQVNKPLPTVNNTSKVPFVDGADIASYAVQDINALVQKGLVEGNAGKVNPLGNTTRAETSVMLYRLFQYLYQ
ncbi:endo-1,4-beta-xylanase [Paenibacillus alginolyticus]|uniref:fibronectin type III domain-containing protein n=1 Tax=Paenibacillus alginolyticus TaxID=59839 RepID=UPI00068656E4|nr:endo-1,4-beta-xylanase [Paenibacillus alginolyticus]MCY9663446.1 endo-1,4-beta-xylanase [Paenibacillus alginolyticus]